MIEWGIIGVAVGLLLSLTGAGGALVSVPLFIHLAGASLADATAYSLFAVIIGASLGWLPQRRHTQWRFVLLFSIFSLLSASIFVRLKQMSPDWLIAALFIAVAATSLLGIWRKRIHVRTEPDPPGKVILRGVLGGLLLGALVTMTGLGGGVILMPIFLGWIQLPMSQAAATSLMAMTFSAVFSLGLQRNNLSVQIDPALIIALAAGSIISSFAVGYIILKVAPEKLDPIRRWVITAVIVISAVTVAFR